MTWQACVGGQCSSVEIDAPCEWTADCGNEQVCDEKEDKCVVAPSGSGATCDENNPCSDGFKCESGECVFVPVSSSCFSDLNVPWRRVASTTCACGAHHPTELLARNSPIAVTDRDVCLPRNDVNL